MLILLPPSETKTARRRGRPVDLDGLSFPGLAATRRTVLDTLAKVSATPDGCAALGVGSALAAEVERNTRWTNAPAVPVSELYTGVLYAALGYPSLSLGSKRRAVARLVVVSAAWGGLRMTDRVPPYRLSIGTGLPGLPPLAGLWRDPLGAELGPLAGDGVIVDCRSTPYVAAWRPTGRQAERWVSVAVVREQAGRRTVVSHLAKHTRGLLARHLLEAGRDPRTPGQLRDLVATRWKSELTRSGAGHLLTVVED